MAATKKARLAVDTNDNGVFVLSASNLYDEVPRDVQVVRIDGSVHYLPDGTFEKCESLQEVIVEEGVQVIGKWAFRGSKALSMVKLPSTLREILIQAFCNCQGLISLELPLGLTYIGAFAFWLTSLRRLEVPATVKTLEKRAFGCCRQLEYISLPPRLEVIEQGLFYGCFQLVDVQIPPTVKVVGRHAFQACTALKQMDFSHHTASVTISNAAFSNCRGLAFVHLPPTLEGSIPDQAFSGCSSLTHIRVPPNVKSIEFRAADGCTSLLSVEIPEGYGSNLLGNIMQCSSLVNLYLPPSQEMERTYQYRSLFPSGGELCKVVPGDVVERLKHRFDGLPLHKVCYFHSYHPLEGTVKATRDILASSPMTVRQVDVLGMTPLHILALAHKPVVELLQELLSSVAMAQTKDRFGSTPLDYLCKNHSLEGMQATRWFVQWLVNHQNIAILRYDRWKRELQAAEEKVKLSTDRAVMNQEVKHLLDKLAEFGFLEVLSLLETSLWKIKLDDCQEKELDKTQQRIDRQGCRVHCGVSIVIANVLPFLGKQVKTTSTIG